MTEETINKIPDETAEGFIPEDYEGVKSGKKILRKRPLESISRFSERIQRVKQSLSDSGMIIDGMTNENMEKNCIAILFHIDEDGLTSEEDEN